MSSEPLRKQGGERMVKRTWIFAKGEWKRQFSDSKVYIVMVCLIFITMMYLGNMPSVVRKSGELIGILELFPLYWTGYAGMHFGIFFLFICDLPSRGFGMRNHVLRTGRNAWFWGETLYMAASVTLYLFLLWAFSVVPFLGNLTIKAKQWSNIIKMAKFGTSMFYIKDVNYITGGTPFDRFWQCFLLIWLCLFLIGMLGAVINMLTGSMTGAILCAAMLVLHIVVMNLAKDSQYPAWFYFFSPITVTCTYTGSIACGIWQAVGYYGILSLVVMAVGRIIAKYVDI